jgi:hypothetical protein
VQCVQKEKQPTDKTFPSVSIQQLKELCAVFSKKYSSWKVIKGLRVMIHERT